jgi:hypothetical protein
MRALTFRRSTDYTAHALEERLAGSLFIPGQIILNHDALALLSYVRGQIESIQRLVAFAENPPCSNEDQLWKHVAVHGFLTGSIDLLWLLREHIGHKLPKRIRLTRGFSHKVSKKDKGPQQEFYSALNEYKTCGVSRIVLIDEVVSGGQVCAALKSFAKWREANKAEHWRVLVLGLTEEARPEVRARLTNEIRQDRNWAEVQLVHVPELLGKDENGIPIKPVMSIETRYVPYRYWGGGYQVRCKNTLTDCSYRLAAADHTRSAYASTVRAICKGNSMRPAVCWPDKCCAECTEVISWIRAAVAKFPRPEQQGIVVAQVVPRRFEFE